MRNKSRKRLLHEQRVRIAKLEQQNRILRMECVRYDPEIYEARILISPHERPDRYEGILKMESERMLYNMIEKILHSGAVEITKTHEFMYDGIADCYRLRLTVLKRRGQ